MSFLHFREGVGSEAKRVLLDERPESKQKTCIRCRGQSPDGLSSCQNGVGSDTGLLCAQDAARGHLV